MKRRAAMLFLIIGLIAIGFTGGIWYGANRTGISSEGMMLSFSIPGEANAQLGCETCIETTDSLETLCSNYCGNRYSGQDRSAQFSACAIGCWNYGKITKEKCGGKKISQ